MKLPPPDRWSGVCGSLALSRTKQRWQSCLCPLKLPKCYRGQLLLWAGLAPLSVPMGDAQLKKLLKRVTNAVLFLCMATRAFLDSSVCLGAHVPSPIQFVEVSGATLDLHQESHIAAFPLPLHQNKSSERLDRNASLLRCLRKQSRFSRVSLHS